MTEYTLNSEEFKSLFLAHNTNTAYFERALFFSWYCAIGDCTFCYMSTLHTEQVAQQLQKKAKRSIPSILAETILCKEFGWKIEFISGGYDAYSKDDLLFLLKSIYAIMGERVWLNIGCLSKEDLLLYKPYAIGYAGTIESVNMDVRKRVCPSKHLQPILTTFKHCDDVGFQKAITIIIGLGETIEDHAKLVAFIQEHAISRVIFYALNPHPDTPFTHSPELTYYCDWILKTRVAFPKIEIIAGAWSDKAKYYRAILESGANSITKLPSLRKFGSSEFREIQDDLQHSWRNFEGNLTQPPTKTAEELVAQYTFADDMRLNIITKLNQYLKKMK